MLKSIPFYTIYIEEGIFYHLGTTQELLNLLTTTIQSNDINNDYSVSERKKLASLAKRYKLQNHVNSKLCDYSKFTNLSNNFNFEEITLDINKSNFISINSYILLNNISSIGHNSVIENSFIYGDCEIGHKSMVSHIHGNLGHNIKIPSNIMFQQIPILSSNNLSYILLTFGIKDNIKSEYNSKGIYLFTISFIHSYIKINIFKYYRFFIMWSIIK